MSLICCWKLREFKRGDSLWLMRGFCLKQGKENLAGGRGTPLNIKSNLKYNSGLIRVLEIYGINYCFLVLSKTGIFFLQPWRSRRSNIVWRGHILLGFSNGKRQSGHTFGWNNTVKPPFKDNFFSQNLHEESVWLPTEGNAFVLVHPHGRGELSRKQAII